MGASAGEVRLRNLEERGDLDEIRPFLERGRGRGDVTLMHAVLRDDAPRELREMLSTMTGSSGPTGRVSDV